MALSKEERDKRFKRGQQSARETIAAKEIFSLRLQPETILRIYEIASSRKIHASDLVRSWIEKCIEAECQTDELNAYKDVNPSISAEIQKTIHNEFKLLEQLLSREPQAEAYNSISASASNLSVTENSLLQEQHSAMQELKVAIGRLNNAISEIRAPAPSSMITSWKNAAGGYSTICSFHNYARPVSRFQILELKGWGTALGSPIDPNQFGSYFSRNLTTIDEEPARTQVQSKKPDKKKK